MAIPTTKSELLAAVNARFARLDAAFDAVPPARASERSMEGHAKGTRMSPNDLLAYLIGWNSLVLKWLEQDDRGEIVEFPEVGYGWNQLGALAQKFYAEYGDAPFDENRPRLAACKDALVREISNRSEAELYGAPWHGKYTKGRMIQFNSSSPYENARARLRKWLKESAR